MVPACWPARDAPARIEPSARPLGPRASGTANGAPVRGAAALHVRSGLPSVRSHCRGRRTPPAPLPSSAHGMAEFACHGTPPAAGRAWVPGCRVRTCGPLVPFYWESGTLKSPWRVQFLISIDTPRYIPGAAGSAPIVGAAASLGSGWPNGRAVTCGDVVTGGSVVANVVVVSDGTAAYKEVAGAGVPMTDGSAPPSVRLKASTGQLRARAILRSARSRFTTWGCRRRSPGGNARVLDRAMIVLSRSKKAAVVLPLPSTEVPTVRQHRGKRPDPCAGCLDQLVTCRD